MESRDFIYHFTDILFSEVVKETILIENWEESDFDYRYAEYADIFIKMKESCLDPARTDDEVFNMLRNSKKKVVNIFNEKMRGNFVKEFERNKLNTAMFDEGIAAELFSKDVVKSDCLVQFRRFEERAFAKKPEKGA